MSNAGIKKCSWSRERFCDTILCHRSKRRDDGWRGLSKNFRNCVTSFTEDSFEKTLTKSWKRCFRQLYFGFGFKNSWINWPKFKLLLWMSLNESHLQQIYFLNQPIDTCRRRSNQPNFILLVNTLLYIFCCKAWPLQSWFNIMICFNSQGWQQESKNGFGRIDSSHNPTLSGTHTLGLEPMSWEPMSLGTYEFGNLWVWEPMNLGTYELVTYELGTYDQN